MRYARLTLAHAALLTCLSVPAAAQAFVLDIDSNASTFAFSGTTNVGPIVGTPPTFRLDGEGGVDVVFGCDGLPAQGLFAGGDAITIPNVVGGQVPNPIFFLPPLATLAITDLHVSYVSSNFAIAPDGTFTANGRLVVLSGTVNFVPLIGDPGVLDLAGFVSDLAPADGQVVVTAATLRVVTALDITIPFDSPEAGVSGVIDLVGTLDGTAPRITTFCDASDGALTACPCSAGAPESGCDLPQGTGGVQLRVAAKTTAPLNRATLTGCGFPGASAPAVIVIRAPTLETSPVVFGDGLRCVGVPLVRLAPVLASGGASTQVIGHGAAAGAGSFHYQAWFRSTPQTYCDAAAAFNLSNGVSLTWP